MIFVEVGLFLSRPKLFHLKINKLNKLLKNDIYFFPFQIKEYEKMETPEERLTKAREIYDHHIMVEMLAHSHVS